MTRPSPVQIVFFASSPDFRAWLAAHHETETELHVGFYKKVSGKPSVTYKEAVDEALCFGWIDGVRHSIDIHAYTIRFTPRKPGSKWSVINIQRVQQLSRENHMHSAGMKAFEGATGQRRNYSYEQRHKAKLAPTEEKQFRANRKAWDYFQSQPPWYRHTATFWIVSAKKDETRQRRLATLILDCEHGRPIKGLTRPVPKWKEKRNGT